MNEKTVKIALLVCAVMAVSCVRKPSAPPEPEPVFEEEKTLSAFMDIEEQPEDITGEENEDDGITRRIIIPYAKEYLSPGQETRLTVYLENSGYGDEMYFEFAKEPGKNNIEVEWQYNAALIRAVREGEQYVEISHPKAWVNRVIVYDVLPQSPPPPAEIDVSESPMIIGKNETKALRMILLNGNAADHEKFRFQVVENAYAIEVTQNGSTLNVTGIAPGAGKIRISNPTALRDYDVMVIVD
ncbi:MAG: hypothetical protein LBG95_08845 [Treponema sp.]|jgi:hypothetical protein|nr:hypothetical protein [Treponema sp.]